MESNSMTHSLEVFHALIYMEGAKRDCTYWTKHANVFTGSYVRHRTIEYTAFFNIVPTKAVSRILC